MKTPSILPLSRMCAQLGLAVMLVACGPAMDAPQKVGATAQPLTVFEQCQKDAVDQATVLKNGGASDAAARKQLEAAFALCEDPARSTANATFLGMFNADFAHLGSDFLSGRLSLAEYRLAVADRNHKYLALINDSAGQQLLSAGDADGDLVADRIDRCPGTTYGLPTDGAGCTTSRPPVGDPTLVRQLSGVKVMYNPSCTDAPVPLTPVPLAWGRGHQTKLGTVGFNVAVSKSQNQPAGCETLYELELRFTSPSISGSPAALHGHVVFREGEDLLSDPLKATFGFPNVGALSPGRTMVRSALNNYAIVSWRVRAVNGSQVASPWSSIHTMGPASGGVPG